MLPATCYVYRHGTCPQYYVITVACVSICQQTDVIGVNLTCSTYVRASSLMHVSAVLRDHT